ncbi:MAG TPA: hypothetical protein VFQ36_08605 [Ktedonobacteraceae bacterium]|nr:hypothetical protein [Ktedonobacteraceae bacterium]
MPNFSIIEDTPAHTYEGEANKDTTYASKTPQIRIKNWHIDIVVMVVGLLSLVFFIALGDMFALLGPWVIYMGVLSIRKRPGSGQQLLRIVAAVGLLCLSVAVLLVPHASRPWCIAGAILGLLAGSSYLAATLFTMRKTLR